jgi:hypothetical protein
MVQNNYFPFLISSQLRLYRAGEQSTVNSRVKKRIFKYSVVYFLKTSFNFLK